MRTARTWVYLTAAMVLLALYAVLLGGGLRDQASFIASSFPLIAAIPALYAARTRRWYSTNWKFLCAALFVWGTSDLLWSVMDILPGGNPEGSPLLMYAYSGFNLLVLASFVYVVVRRQERLSTSQFIIDTLAIFASNLAFLWFVIFRDNSSALLYQDHAAVSSLICVLADVLIFTFALSVMLSNEQSKVPLFLKLLFVGTLAFVFIDVTYVYAFLNGLYTTHSLIDLGYILAMFFYGLSACVYLDSPGQLSDIRLGSISQRKILYRSGVLLVIPLVATVTGQVSVMDALFFLLIVLTHQTVSLFIRRIKQDEMELEEKSRQTERLEALIADRTRELKIMNQTLENLLKKDAITGQYNRKFFLEKVDEWISAGQQTIVDERCESVKIWLLILDFDRFKSVNDTYGHDVGDQTLRITAKRLDALSNERTVFARLGGDEFGVVCQRCAAERIEPLIQRIHEIVSEPVKIGLFTIHVTLSIGISSWPNDAKSRSDLMRHADIAMYLSKRQRGGCSSFFDSLANAGVERNHQIDLALSKCPFEREFSVVYQPQFAVGGRRLVGMEALARWNSREFGTIPPDEFIPIAEENGVILPLSDWVMEKSLRQIASWNKKYGTSCRMGINVSPVQLDDDTFLQRLELLLTETGASPQWVNLEFTERSAMKDESFIVNIFNKLSSLGIVSSMDDFGTGYSSLSYLKRFNIDYLKIAKQLIDGIATNETEEEIVQAIIMMATALGLRTIAEGVEEESQLRKLEALGCDEIQGYYFGRPVPPDEFEELFLKS